MPGRPHAAARMRVWQCSVWADRALCACGRALPPVLRTGAGDRCATARAGESRARGLLAQVLAPTPDTDVWRAYRLAAALLLDLPSPKILLRVSGDMHFATADGAAGRAVERFDLSRGDLEGMRSQLSQGSLWYCDSEQEAALLPVSLQRLMRLSHGDACVIVPMISDGTLEALALHRLSSALLPGLRARAGELDMLVRLQRRVRRICSARTTAT
jgi:hypothetical protein